MILTKAFPRHEHRTVHSLNGLWDFTFLGDIDWDTVDPGQVETQELMPVPAAFDAMPDFAGQRGLALYRKQLRVTSGRRLLLHFEAVSMGCRVFVDGQLIADHDCGFSPFWCEAPATDSPTREITVLVDNRFNFEQLPLHEHFFDFYQWGGIIRDVWAHEVGETYFKEVRVRIEDAEAGLICVDVEFSGPPAGLVKVAIDDAAPVELPYRHGEPLKLQVPKPQTWSPESPHLHLLQLETESDDIVVRFGLRKIETRDQQILLNGSPLKLLGFNRHESHPQFGPALPYAQLVADLQQLRDLGCNFVRGSHYPQDQRFLDLCDEMGFLVWEEGLGWGQREKQLTDEHFRSSHLRMIREMVSASFNHPSVILWGFLNEAASNEAYAQPIFEETAALLRKLDPSRPITYASMFPLEDRYYDLVDVISHNLYPGWYGCEDIDDPLGLILPRIRECLDHVNSLGKPYILSEIGVEGLYGWHDSLNGFFTEEYQARYLETVCQEVLSNEQITGCALWHFSDARTYTGGRALMRPRAFNNKGILDEYRRPKRAYEHVRRLWKKS